MKKGRFVRSIAKLLCVTTCATAVVMPLVGCNNGSKEKILMLATDAPDTVFNPFFYTSGVDGDIVGQTQIGMLSGDDKTGEPKAGWDEPCVAFEYSIYRKGDKVEGNNDYTNFYTDYYLALKDDIKFSDGEPLTKDDVLFNMYMYLDPAYTGSSTMYSVKIKGLKEYRTQTRDLNNIGQAEQFFQNQADIRTEGIIAWTENDLEGDWGEFDAYEPTDKEVYGDDKVVASDIDQIQKYYRQSLEESWTSVISADIEKEYEKYKDQDGQLVITEPWQLFLYMYSAGFTLIPHYTGSGADARISYYEVQNSYSGSKDKESLINYVYNKMFFEQNLATESYKTNLKSVLLSYPVNVYMNDYLLADVKYRKFKDHMDVEKVEGIEIKKMNKIPTGKDGEITYIVLKDKNGNPKEYDVLHIRIDGLDPKAIQNFGFTVAPGHYYSDPETWKKAVDDTTDQKEFGVKFSNPDFMNSIRVKQLPLGAGAYLAAKRSGGTAQSKSDFFDSDNIVYFEANPNFMLGEPKIKKLRYKVISNSQLFNAIKTGDVHYASPSMKQEDINELTTLSDLSSAQTLNLGYGYIGVSARYIPNIYIRKAIMTTFDPQVIISSYYGEGASVITRPMSKTLADYYPNAPAYEEYVYDKTGEKAKALLLAGGCSIKNGVMCDEKGTPLKYTFTIAGDSDDHPANSMFINSEEILEKLGLDITVTHDSMALNKLSSGLLTVWAAAWSSSTDPDMYQVYHKDSQATSTTAWGYKYIFSSQFQELASRNNPKNYDQRDMISKLSDKIDDGRETLDKGERKVIYSEALDMLMDLAVEFPTYQRQLYYIWRKGIFNENTLQKNISAYNSPLSKIWEVELA